MSLLYVGETVYPLHKRTSRNALTITVGEFLRVTHWEVWRPRR